MRTSDVKTRVMYPGVCIFSEIYSPPANRFITVYHRFFFFFHILLFEFITFDDTVLDVAFAVGHVHGDRLDVRHVLELDAPCAVIYTCIRRFLVTDVQLYRTVFYMKIRVAQRTRTIIMYTHRATWSDPKTAYSFSGSTRTISARGFGIRTVSPAPVSTRPAAVRLFAESRLRVRSKASLWRGENEEKKKKDKKKCEKQRNGVFYDVSLLLLLLIFVVF